MKFNTKIFKGIVFLAKNNRGFLFFVLLLFVAGTARAQSQEFFYRYSCPNGNACFGYRQALQLTDNTYLVAGETGFMYYQIRLMKIDSLGNLLWVKNVTTELSFETEGIKELGENKFIIYGCFNIYEDSILDPYHSDAGLVCVDSAGNKLWEKRYGAVPPTGNTYGYDYCEYIYNLKVANNRLYALGYSNSYNAGHFDQPWAFCTDFNGDTLWTWSFSDLPYAKNACMKDIVFDDNGDCLIVGNLGDYDEFKGNSVIKGAIFKLDTGGNLLWYRLWAPICPTEFTGIEKISEDEYVLCGSQATCPTDQFFDTCRIAIGVVAKINADGEITDHRYILKGSENELNTRFVFVRDSLIFVVGIINWFEGNANNIFINTYNTNLELLEEKNYGNRNEIYIFYNYSKASSEAILIAGTFRDTTSLYSYVLKTDSLLNCPLPQGWSFVRPNYLSKEIILYPNPAGEAVNIETAGSGPIGRLQLFDVTGSIVYENFFGETTGYVPLSSVMPGLYIVKVENKYIGKLIINH